MASATLAACCLSANIAHLKACCETATDGQSTDVCTDPECNLCTPTYDTSTFTPKTFWKFVEKYHLFNEMTINRDYFNLAMFTMSMPRLRSLICHIVLSVCASHSVALFETYGCLFGNHVPVQMSLGRALYMLGVTCTEDERNEVKKDDTSKVAVLAQLNGIDAHYFANFSVYLFTGNTIEMLTTPHNTEHVFTKLQQPYPAITTPAIIWSHLPNTDIKQIYLVPTPATVILP